MRNTTGWVHKIFSSLALLILLALVAGLLNVSASIDSGPVLNIYIDNIIHNTNSMLQNNEPSDSYPMPSYLIPLFIADKIPRTVLNVGVHPAFIDDPIIDANVGSDDPVVNPKVYDYSAPAPETDEVSNEYFSDALFIGDSRTVGLMNYSGVKSYYYAKVALNIKGVLTNAFIDDYNSGECVTRTIIDTVREYPQFKKVYISFGLNELGWSENIFINTYEYVVEQFKEILPDALIYVQAVIPVSKSVSDIGKNGVKNSTIERYNVLLQELAERQKVFYLAIDEAFRNENGCLDDDRSSDGIHMNGDSIREQVKYFKTHTVNLDDYK